MAPALMVCWIEGGAVNFLFSVLARRRRRATGPIAAGTWRRRPSAGWKALTCLAAHSRAREDRGGDGAGGRRRATGSCPLRRCRDRCPGGAINVELSLRLFGWRFYPLARGCRGRATNFFFAKLSDLRLRCIVVDGRSTLAAPSYRVVSALCPLLAPTCAAQNDVGGCRRRFLFHLKMALGQLGRGGKRARR